MRYFYGVVFFVVGISGGASGETVTLATYNIENFQQNFRAHELGKKLPRDIQDPVLKELLTSEREGDDEDNWELAQVITHPEFNPDVLVIEEGCTQENLEYFNKRWLNNAYGTAVVFATNTDRDQHLAMLLKPGFKLIEKRDQYHKEKDPVANERGDRLFARGPAFCLVETPRGYRFWAGVTHQKSKRVDFGKEQADAIYAANPGVPREQVEQKIAEVKRKLAVDAAAWRNREAKRTHEIMLELEKTGTDDVILLGDMNDEIGQDEAEKQAGADAVATLLGPPADGFVLATRPLAEKGEFSFGGYYRTDFRTLIDHAVLTKGMKDQVQAVGVFKGGLTPVASDHYPVYVKVKADAPAGARPPPPRMAPPVAPPAAPRAAIPAAFAAPVALAAQLAVAAPADAASTRPAPPSLTGVRVLDSTSHSGRPARLHPSKHMIRAVTPHSFWSPRPADIGIKALQMRRNGWVATLDMEWIRGVEGMYPSGNEDPETFRKMIDARVRYVQEFRNRLGEGWPIAAYGLLPNTQFYAPLTYAAFNDPSADAWRRDPNHPEVKPHLDKVEPWRRGNDRIAAALLPHVDFLCPQLYVFDDHPLGWKWLLEGMITESRRVAGGKPVYAFLTPTYWEVDKNPRGGQPIPYEFFKHQLDTCLAVCDGVVIWGGWDQRFDPQAGWVRALREKLDELDAADARRPGGPATKPAAGAGTSRST